MEEGLHITLAAERLFTFWGVPITNTILTSWVVIAILLVLGFLVRKNVALIPGKLQNLIEMFFEYLLSLMEQTLGDRKLAMKYFPLIATIFLFILFANWFDFIPVFGTVGFHLPAQAGHGEEFIPLFHPVNADLNTTLALAIISFFVIEISGIVTLGVLKYAGKFVNFTGGVMGFLVGLIEIIGNLARLVSLSFRLFGAIFAGEVLLLVIGSFVPILLPVPLMAFEAFIGLLQAAIFAILTLAFIKLAITEHAH